MTFSQWTMGTDYCPEIAVSFSFTLVFPEKVDRVDLGENTCTRTR